LHETLPTNTSYFHEKYPKQAFNMKKYIHLLFVLFLLGGTAAVVAQPTFYINPDFVLINSGEQTCLEVRVFDFTDIQSVQFSINWNSNTVNFLGVQNLNPNVTGLDMSDFTIDAFAGTLAFDWRFGTLIDCSSNIANAVTRPDEEVLFELCFEGIVSYSDIDFTNTPLPQYVTRPNSCPLNIGMIKGDGFIAVENLPVTINVPNISANQGETICVDFTIENFTEIVSMQFTVNWVPQVLEFVSATGVNLPSFGGSNINLLPSGSQMTLSWAPPLNPVTLPDGTVFLQMCFNVVGTCGQMSTLEISSNPTPVEITNSAAPGINVGVLYGEGIVNVSCINPNTVSVFVESAQVDPGEDFCLDVTVGNFTALRRFRHSLTWNPNLLQFLGIQNINPNLFFFNAGSFGLANASIGVITVNWNDPSCLGGTLPNDAVLFSICFRAVGGCLAAPVTIVNNPLGIEVNNVCFGSNIGMNIFNGLVQIVCPPGITLSSDNLEADPGTEVCVPVYASEFNNIQDMAFTMEWESAVLSYSSVQNFNLPGLNASNFDVSISPFGAICVNWSDPSGTGITLPNDEALFDVCFNAIGAPYTCSIIDFSGFPCDANVVSSDAPGVNIGLNSEPGSVCMTNPFNFTVNIGNGAGLPGTEVCVNVSVSNFVSLESMAFTIQWDPTLLQFNDLLNALSLNNFTASSYNANGAQNGFIIIDWKSLNANGNSLANNTIIFTLCFQLLGDGGVCPEINIVGLPQAIEVIPANAGGINIGINPNNGEICIAEALSLVSVNIEGVDCAGDNTGSIFIEISGGSSTYFYDWAGPGLTPPGNSAQNLFNLTNGTYSVTVIDQLNPALTYVDTFMVGFSMLAPIANAGLDTVLPCGSPVMQLNGTASSQGPQYTYFWTSLGSGAVDPTSQNQLTPTIIGNGNYQLAVTDNTLSCTVFDTVFVAAAISPAAVAGKETDLTCANPVVQLTGFGSTANPAITYLWTTPDGALVPGTETSIDAQASSAGLYFLIVTNNNSNCSSTDSILVVTDTIPPTAIAGDDQAITCIVNSVTLDASGSDEGPNLIYAWTEPNGDVTDDELTFLATAPGFYVFSVTDTSSGCVGIDSVLVNADTELPNADAGPNAVITCANPLPALNGSGSSTGLDFSYLWTGPGVVPGTETQQIAQASNPGTFTLEVTDNSNGCVAISQAVVTLNITPPIAQAGPAAAISCAVTQTELNGTGSSTGAAGAFTYMWSGPGTIANGTTLLPTVNQPGTFFIEVTSTANGCTATDSVVVNDNTTPPSVAITNPAVLTCSVINVTLNTAGTDTGAEFNYIWSGPFCINQTNPLAPIMGCPGTFTLEVINTSTGCSATASTTITQNVSSPVAFAPNATINCLVSSLTLDGSQSSQGANFIYSWSPVPAGNGLILSGANTLMPEIGAPGAYGLIVTDTTNGCTGNHITSVQGDTIAPFVTAGEPATITCDMPEVQLSGFASAPGANFELEWSFGGNVLGNQLTLSVNAPGTYTLTATNPVNGCSASDDVEVNTNTDLPLVELPEEAGIECGETSVTLSGNVETGPDILYSWSALSGELDPGSVSNATALALSPGVYVLLVSNEANGCLNSDTITVVNIINFPNASAGIDGDACDRNALLFANLPDGTTGVWTSTSSVNIVDPTNPNSEVDRLVSGVNTFIWTLSADGCPNFSSDTVSITIQGQPIANNDIALIQGDNLSVDISAVANDILTGVPNWTFSIIPPLPLGQVEFISPGNLTYTTSPAFSGAIDIYYELCNDVCPNLCDTAFIRVTVDRDVDLNQEVPNAITPNGDGINDAFIFDILFGDPNDFPDNEIIIFNRWGDIVYQAKPYINNWEGTNQNGQPLPQATYYYILYLNRGESKLIKGDVTILR
jgi:gliding motility-associated-like protein